MDKYKMGFILILALNPSHSIFCNDNADSLKALNITLESLSEIYFKHQRQKDIDSLMLNISAGNIESVEKALNTLNLDPNITDKYSNPPIFLAIINDNKPMAQLLLKKFNIDAQNKSGYTALMLTVYYYNPDIAQLLIENHANLNIQNQDGNTALMLAAFHNATGIIRLLLERDADINIKNNKGETAEDIATHPNILKLIQDKKKAREEQTN